MASCGSTTSAGPAWSGSASWSGPGPGSPDAPRGPTGSGSASSSAPGGWWSDAGRLDPGRSPGGGRQRRHRRVGQRRQQGRGRRRVGRVAVDQCRDGPGGAGQRARGHPRVPVRGQGQRGQRGHPEAGRDQGLDGDVVVGGEGDPRAEAERGALPQQVGPAALAAGDPGAAGVLGQRRPAAAGPGQQRHRLVQQRRPAQPGFRPGGRVRVLEDHRHVDLAGPHHPHRLGWFGLEEAQLDARVGGGEGGGRGGHEGPQRGRERGQPDPARAQPGVRRQLRLRRRDPAQDLLRPLGQHPPGGGQPDPAAGPLQQSGAGLGLQPGQVVRQRRLDVPEFGRGGGDRAVPGDGGQRPEPGEIEHPGSMAAVYRIRRCIGRTSALDRSIREDQHGRMETELTLDDVRRARTVLADLLPPTPLWSYPALNQVAGATVHVKHENTQPVGAFKVRGGLTLLAGLPAGQRERGLITYSTGNHAQSLAYACNRFGVRCVVVMPLGANEAKVRSVEALGGEVILSGTDLEGARQHAEERAVEHGLGLVSCGDEPALVAGVGTLYLELFEALPDLDAVLVPVGAGSGAAAACLVAEALAPGCEVIAVQSAASPAAHDSWHSGRLQRRPNTTRVEGLATGRAFALTQGLLRGRLKDFVLVSDDQIEAAARLLASHAHTLAEGAGAAALAALLADRDRFAGRQVAVICTGGNASVAELTAMAAGFASDGLAADGMA